MGKSPNEPCNDSGYNACIEFMLPESTFVHKQVFII